MTILSAFRSVRTVGTVLPSEALARAVDLWMPGQSAEDYRLTPGMTVNAAVARAWDAVLGAHRVWKAALDRLPAGDPATGLTRDKWLLPLLYELGYGRPEHLAAGIDLPPGMGETEPLHFPISHRLAWPQAVVPVHLAGGGVTLDTRTPKVAARAPQSMVQDFLNRSGDCLWGIVSNGHILRVLRDASSLTKQSYVEFDLDDIFDNQRYSDFRLFFLTVHASRFTPVPEGSTSDTCWLEKWRASAIADGARALEALREGVAAALTHLGTGFVSHPANTELVSILAASPNADKDLHRALLRIAYRLIVLFVAEDRELLHTASEDTGAQELYAKYFSTARLRNLATTRTGTRHTDLWDAHLIVTDALAADGLDTLALPGLGATLFSRDNLGILANARLPNRSLLAAVRALAEITDPRTGLRRRVDYRNLDSEELGGVYEGLLAYTPRYDSTTKTFTLDLAAGNDRKKSGSYYTPSDLIALVLDETLDPLIAEALRADDPEAALLGITTVDPAVGSGHFVVAAARRIATALATVRTGDTEPGPQALRTATADVIEHCVYGVDLNDLAIEITKVALWLEAFDGSRPLPFLDSHLKVGNALLGTTPALLAANIPDEAFKVLGDDDPAETRALRSRNKEERKRAGGQFTLFERETLDVETITLAKKARELDEASITTLAQARERADAWRRFEEDPDLTARKLAADAWCAAFVQPKGPEHRPGITYDTLRQIVDNPDGVPERIRAIVRNLARQYRFFHWHLEFPGIFTVPEPGTTGVDPATGWQGGFTCVLGNPPWETLQLDDAEFFAAIGRDDIAKAGTAAIRKKKILALSAEDPPIYDSYQAARRTSDATNHLVRGGRFPLTATGKINTYSVFAETMRTIMAPTGAAGTITPTGLATDNTTAPFFGDTLANRRLIAFYDFENEAKIFAEVHHSFRFAVTAIAGIARPASRTRFAFYTRYLADVPGRRFELDPGEVTRMNPNTGTLPMFRTRIDADITLGIYRRHPVLIQDGTTTGNPWHLRFSQGLFNMASDSGLFRQATDLADLDFNGWSYQDKTVEYLPLYEAKMLGHFDHRFSTYRDATQMQLNVGSLPRPTDEQHDDPEMEPLARYWVARPSVTKALQGKWDRDWLLGWRDIARTSDMRTFVPSVLPTSAVGDPFLLAFPADPNHGPLLHAVWSSLAFDYVARQKLSGTHMKYFTVKQLACPTPATFAEATSWQSERTLAEWVVSYVLELSYTSWRLKPYAEEMGDDGPPFRWDSDRRALLRADLDAAFLHVYGLTRPEAEHVLDSFPVVRKYEERDHGEYRTRRLVLDAYDRMATAAARGGRGWTPLAPIPAGEGPRHSP